MKNNIRCRRCESLYDRHAKKLVESWGFCRECIENEAEILKLLLDYQLKVEKKVKGMI